MTTLFNIWVIWYFMKWMAFLRGVGTRGAHALTDMSATVYMLEDTGLQNVRFFGSHGSYTFESGKTRESIRSDIRSEFVNTYGMDFTVFVYTLDEISAILSDAVPKATGGSRAHIIFTEPGIGADAAKDLSGYGSTTFPVSHGCICVNNPGAKYMRLETIEKQFGVYATSRTVRSLERMMDLQKTS